MTTKNIVVSNDIYGSVCFWVDADTMIAEASNSGIIVLKEKYTDLIIQKLKEMNYLVKSRRQSDEGKLVLEVSLVNATSVEDASAKVRETGVEEIAAVAESKITEVIHKDEDKFFIAKYTIFTSDERSGKESKTKCECVVGSSTIEMAQVKFKEHTKTWTCAWELNSFSDTKIVEII